MNFIFPMCRRLLAFPLLPTLLPLPLYATNQIIQTISSCGKPTQQRDIGDKKEGLWLLYYNRQHTNLIYEKVGGQWNWSFADDHESTSMLSGPEVVSRMPCMEQIVNSSSAPAAEASRARATSETTSISAVGNDSYRWYPVVVSLGLVLLIVVLVPYFRIKNLQELRATASVPVRCPRCGSPQVHAEKRGWNLMMGPIRSSKILITCLHCGNRFKPGQGA